MGRLMAAAMVMAMMTTAARADELVVYGAGSLREAIGQIAAEFGQSHSLTVNTQFGPSGRMRERIEKGDHVDLFTSAEVQFPPGLLIGREYGLAVLRDAHPAAALLALTILSPEGQKLMVQRGFRPVTLPSD